jgi:hypothetical protein
MTDIGKPLKEDKVTIRVLNWKGIGWTIVGFSYLVGLIYFGWKLPSLVPDSDPDFIDQFCGAFACLIAGTAGVAFFGTLAITIIQGMWECWLTKEIEVDLEDIPHAGTGDGLYSDYYSNRR